MLTPRGRILGDVTVARLGEDRFWLMGSPVAEPLYLRWLTSQAGADRLQISSKTRNFCGFSVTGPLARELLSRCCPDEVSNTAFPFLSVRELTVGLAPVIAIRISFTGELGYELYTSPEYQRQVHETLVRFGRPLGLREFGVRALNSLRLEKAYGGWGREYTQDYTPAEAGLQRLVNTGKPRFIGREAVLAQFASRPERRLSLLAVDSADPDPAGGEPVLQDGRPIARLTSAAFGHTVGHALGLAYLPAETANGAPELEVELLGTRVKARVLQRVPYDPAATHLRA
jgi:dimethylglycine dehydrogenase